MEVVSTHSWQDRMATGICKTCVITWKGETTKPDRSLAILFPNLTDDSARLDKTPTPANITSANPTDDTMSSQPTTGDPSSGQQPVQKQEGADRPTEAPTNPAENQAVQETKQDAETTQQAGTDDDSDRQQQDSSASDKDAAKPTTDGEGKHPKTEEERQEMAVKGELPKIPGDRSGEPLRMHDGDGADADPSDRPEGEGDKPDQSESAGQEGGGEHGKEKGTGEKYVRSTGLAADGGDFDATRPGAGREATRLMEEKGLHKSKDGGDDPDAGKPPPPEPSKMEKLKDKLHIGTGKHGNEQSV